MTLNCQTYLFDQQFCGSLNLLSISKHMDSTHASGNQIVYYGKYKIVTYALKVGK